MQGGSPRRWAKWRKGNPAAPVSTCRERRSSTPDSPPWEIFLSEAQERMTLAVPPADLESLLELARATETWKPRSSASSRATATYTSSGASETVALLEHGIPPRRPAPEMRLTATVGNHARCSTNPPERPVDADSNTLLDCWTC